MYSYPKVLQPLHNLISVFLPHQSQILLAWNLSPRPFRARVCDISSARRSQAPPHRQIGAAMSNTVGSNSGNKSGPGERKESAKWWSSFAGFVARYTSPGSSMQDLQDAS